MRRSFCSEPIHYLREMCRNKIIEACVPEAARDWAVARISAREAGWDEILRTRADAADAAPRQVIIVEDAESVEKLGEKSRDEVLAMLGNYLASPAPFTVLVLEAAALDGRQKFSKLLSEKALVVELTIGAESAAALAAQMAKDLGAEIDREAAAHAGGNSERRAGAHSHRAGKTGHLRAGTAAASPRRDVEALVVAARKNTVWQLAEMLASRKRDAALAFLDNLLREGEQPAVIVGALAWTYRKLIEARDLPAQTQRISGGAATGHASGSGRNGRSPGAPHSEEGIARGAGGAGRGRQPVEVRESGSARADGISDRAAYNLSAA